jgi:hypothetical protein
MESRILLADMKSLLVQDHHDVDVTVAKDSFLRYTTTMQELRASPPVALSFLSTDTK